MDEAHAPFEGRAYSRDELAKQLGPRAATRLFTLVDAAHKRVRVVEEREVQGAAEWAAANRRRGRGPVIDSRVDGKTLITDASLSDRPGAGPAPLFGPAEAGKGGEVLEACFMRGKDVVTRWKGLAGAGLGLAASLGMSPGALEFRAEGLEHAGGSSVVRMEVVTPGLNRFLIGIDDTDTPKGGATWALARDAASAIEDMAVLRQRVVQLFPGVPEKTTNCVASLIEAAVAPWMEEAVKIELRDRVESLSKSPEVGLAHVKGLLIHNYHEAESFCEKARGGIVTREQADAAARAVGAEVPLDGRGAIGAIAALGCAQMGPEAADVAQARAPR